MAKSAHRNEKIENEKICVVNVIHIQIHFITANLILHK